MRTDSYKDERLQIRVNKALNVKIKKLAKHKDMTVAQYVRAILLNHIADVRMVTKKVVS